MSGFVDTVLFTTCPVDSQKKFLRGVFLPPGSFVMTHTKYGFVWRARKATAELSWCTCTAGTAEVCNHIIALMYKVNFAYKKAYISPACTSVPQGWNRGTKKDVQPSQIKKLVFRKDKKTDENSARDQEASLKLKNQFDPRKTQDRQLTNGRVSALVTSVMENTCIPSADGWSSRTSPSESPNLYGIWGNERQATRADSSTISQRLPNDKRPSCKSGSWNPSPEHKLNVASAEDWKSNSFQLPHIPHKGTDHSQPERPQWQ